jgi:hypothetical protein
MTKIYFHGTRQQAKSVVRRLKDILIGRASDPQRLAYGVFLAIGFAALSDIKDDFVRKADGGTGEDGVKWPDLSPAYKAYGRRFGKGEQSALKKAAGLGKANRFAPGQNKGLLTAHQLKIWRGIYGTRLQRFLVSMPEPAAKARAAQIAWAELKRMGAKTKLSVFGSRKVQILRDTGILLNSLSPGRLDGGQYSKPSEDGGEEQICQTIANGVIVGTNVPYAAVHNNGSAAKGIPARPFLPKGEAPQVWQERWEKVAGDAIDVAIRLAYEGAA